MKQRTFQRTIGFLAFVALLAPLAQASAGAAKKGIAGDWQVTVDFEGRKMTSILSFSEDKEGKLTGKWISFWGVTELRDLTYEGKQLSFLQVYQMGENETRVNFAGTIEKQKLSGVLSSDRGESKVEGKRIVPMPAAMGGWEMKVKAGDREFTGTLIIKADKEDDPNAPSTNLLSSGAEAQSIGDSRAPDTASASAGRLVRGGAGKLVGEWKSERGEHEITDVSFKGGKLSFTRKSKIDDRQWESTFAGTVKGHTLSGVFKSERGESTAEGTRIGAALVGKWELEITSERGTRTQLLQVNPDLSGFYGSTAVKKVDLKDGQAAFNIALEFGEQKFEIDFKGKLEDNKLTGELTTSRGTQKVTGKKVVPAAKKG